MSSLLASVLLLIALMLGAVLAFDLWRSYRIRRAQSLSDDTRKPVRKRALNESVKDASAASVGAQPASMASPVGPRAVNPTNDGTDSDSDPGVSESIVRSDRVTPLSVDQDVRADSSLAAKTDLAISADSSEGRAVVRDEPVLGERLLPAAAAPPGGRTEPSLGSLFDSPPAAAGLSNARPVVPGKPHAQEVSVAGGPHAPAARTAGSPSQRGADRPIARPLPQAAPAVSALPPVLSERTDCVVVLHSNQGLEADRVLQLVQDFRRVGAKPVVVEACRDTGDPVSDSGAADPTNPGRSTLTADSRWHGLVKGEPYSALRIGLLMANRAGPLNAMDYSDFIARVRQLGERLGCRVVAPDMAGVLARARALDAECMRLDAQVGLNVQTAQVLSPPQLAGLAAPLRVSERGNNRYARLTEQGQTIFSVALADEPNRVSLLLDVPRVPEALRPWSAMADCAQIAAQHLDGHLVDDAGRELNVRAVEQIGLQLANRYRELEAAGLMAGSPAALRVFN